MLLSRPARAAVVAGSFLAASTLGVSPAHAAGITVTMPITGSATLAKTNTTLAIPAGAQLSGVIVNGTVTGSLSMPEITAHVRIFDVPRFGDTTSTVRIVETAPATATFAPDGTVTATATVRIELPRVTSDLLPSVNIVRSTCRSKPFTVQLAGGPVNLAAPFPMGGTFAIPAFERCGFAPFGGMSGRDLLISSLLSGPGNTMNLMAGPATIVIAP